jgi:hypothetical protein
VDIRDMREAASNLARILIRMATMDKLPFERKSKVEINAMLQKYDYDEVMEILESYPSWLK